MIASRQAPAPDMHKWAKRLLQPRWQRDATLLSPEGNTLALDVREFMVGDVAVVAKLAELEQRLADLEAERGR